MIITYILRWKCIYLLNKGTCLINQKIKLLHHSSNVLHCIRMYFIRFNLVLVNGLFLMGINESVSLYWYWTNRNELWSATEVPLYISCLTNECRRQLMSRFFAGHFFQLHCIIISWLYYDIAGCIAIIAVYVPIPHNIRVFIPYP